MLNVDTGFPDINKKGSTDEKLRDIYNYLYMLVEQLRYSLANLGVNNFNEKEIESLAKTITEPVYLSLEKDGRLTSFSITEEGLQVSFNSEGKTESRLIITDSALNSKIDGLASESSVTQLSDKLSAIVKKKINETEICEAKSEADFLDTSKFYVIKAYDDETGKTVIGETYYYYNSVSKEWEAFDGADIYTVFEQKSDGFYLKGNTVIDGETVITKNLKLSGNVTWDMSNSPVKTEYSVDGSNDWHEAFNSATDKFMHMSFDGGKNWSTPTRIVGEKGSDGINGTDGKDGDEVDAKTIFNLLTDNAGVQGIFPCFVKGTDTDGETKIFINAEYIRGKTISGLKFADASGSNYIMLSHTVNEYGTVSAGFADLGLYTSKGTRVWSVNDYNGSVRHKRYGSEDAYLVVDKEKASAEGDWDFSGANVTGIPLYFG